MSNQPFFSIIIPTKDRPNFVGYALQSVKNQIFENFECILINNSEDEEPTKDVFLQIVKDDTRFSYFRPERVLPMHENWQYGLSRASGKYISILIDKVMLLPNILSASYCYMQTINQQVDVISWWSDAYNFKNEEFCHAGYYKPFWEFRFPEVVSAKSERNRRFNFVYSRMHEGHLYFRGKICFGFYSKNLIKQVSCKIPLFEKFSPDYTSLAAMLCCNITKIHDLGLVGCISINTNLSNGRQGENNVNRTLSFMRQSDPQLNVLNDLALPGIPESLHNFVARDYIAICKKLNISIRPIMNGFIKLRIYEDLKRKDLDKKILNPCKMFFLNCMNRLHLMFHSYQAKRVQRKILLLGAKVTKFFPARFYDELMHRDVCLKDHFCNDPIDALALAHQHYCMFKSIKYKQDV